jgi:hypothetical protein
MCTAILGASFRQLDLALVGIDLDPFEVSNLGPALAREDQQPNYAAVIIVEAGSAHRARRRAPAIASRSLP